MRTRTETPAPSLWLGAPAAESAPAESPEPFGRGQLWIGEHSADGDILVFDPAEADPTAEALAFYSMTQLRSRVFPRAVVALKIREITDDIRSARAAKDYGRRTELRAAREDELASARSARAERQREQVLQQHQRYLAARELPYAGVERTPAKHRPSRRRVRCHACGIALDDFAGTICCTCRDVLCSCGACACGASAAR